MALSADQVADLGELVLYGIGIAGYALLVALLWVPMSQRMMFARRFGERAVATPGRRFLYVLLFPLVSFLFFVLVASAMLFMGSLSAGNLDSADVLTLSMAVVLAIRVTAYFSEDAAADLAKVLPLGMLGVLLVTNGLSNLGESLRNLRAFGDEPVLLGLYFAVVVVMEFALRIVYELLGRPNKDRTARFVAVPEPRGRR